MHNTDPESASSSSIPEQYAGKETGEPNDIDTEERNDMDAETSSRLSRRLTGGDSLLEEAKSSKDPIPTMGGDRPYPPMVPDREKYTVTYDGPNDPTHPHNWALSKKILMCACVGLSALSISMGSAMFAASNQDLMVNYHIGATTATLGTSLFVFGFASGPVIFGPLSELFGRKIVLVPSSLGYVCFSFAVATAKDIQTIMICRFFAGFIGAAPLVVAPAAMADLFGAATRGQAMAIFAMVLFGGPMLSPILGAFTVKNPGLGWRWTSYFSALIGVLSLILNVFVFQETHHPLILKQKAEKIRRRTGNWAVQASHEQVSLSLKEIAEKNVTRPLMMLFTEPILFLITLYNSFIYGLLYLFLTAVPMVFLVEYRFKSGVAELPYLAMLIGVFIGGVICILFERRFNRVMHSNGGKPVPEERLPPMMIGSVLFAGGLFWLGWAGSFPERVHWIVPTIGTSFIGAGLITIFLPCINYIVDCYLYFAASALAGNTFLRSAFGAAFPLFARQMFVNMEIKWASTLLGCLAVVLIPVPFLFYIYGKRIRTKSKYAFVL